MRKPASHLLTLVLLAALPLCVACQARKDFPEPTLGSHSPNYDVVFGRVRVVPGSNADAPSVWTIRFGNTSDAYQGEFALTPASKLVGYAGGEPVQLKGHILADPTADAYNGRWYVVDSIQLWSGYRQ